MGSSRRAPAATRSCDLCVAAAELGAALDSIAVATDLSDADGLAAAITDARVAFSDGNAAGECTCPRDCGAFACRHSG